MKVLIIEDENPAVEKLENYLQRYDSSVEIVGKTKSIETSVNWLKNAENKCDLIFSDIQLTDGLSFEIFEYVKISKPIIFTTAYNEYAIRAFKTNSIDYLLKPITYNDFYNSMQKLESLRENLQTNKQRIQIEELGEIISQYQKKYKSRFLVKIGDHIRSITSEKILLFFAEGRNVFLVSNKGNRFFIEYKLEELENILDPQTFFRVNRSFILNINSIKDVLVYSGSRLKISLITDFDKEIIVSRDKVNQFKNWFSGID